MDFSTPEGISKELDRFKAFLETELLPNLQGWYEAGAVPRSFFDRLGQGGWFGYERRGDTVVARPSLEQSALMEHLATLSPGVGVAVAVHTSLGMKALHLFGSVEQKARFFDDALAARKIWCLGNTESNAGSDVAAVTASAVKVDGGFLATGTKAFVTNGTIADVVVATAVTDPDAERTRRHSMFIVPLDAPGVSRRKLHKDVWIPSDLTRIQFRDVFIPDADLLGERGRGIQQVLEIFTESRIAITALTTGTALGAFELALRHAGKREVFGTRLARMQAKSFEIAHLYARIEAARLALRKAAWTRDAGRDFRLESSIAKYLAVDAARETVVWAADLFGAVSVMVDHPVHKFPLDAWASSLGEGTQDVQKLVIFREVMRRYGYDA